MHRRLAKLFLALLMALVLAVPGVAVADDDDDDEKQRVINALCTQREALAEDDTDRSNICPLTQGQYP